VAVAGAGGGGGANIFSPRATEAGQLKLFKTDFWLQLLKYFYCTAQTDLSSGKPFLAFTCSQFLAAAGNDGPCILYLCAACGGFSVVIFFEHSLALLMSDVSLS
jgi:hypothetical protein